MKLITIKTFDNAIEAHLMKTKFESEGINCFILDENIISINPLFNNMIGGVKLKINKKDTEAAQEILKKISQTKLTDDDNKNIKCPKCQSEDLIYGFKSMKGLKGLIATIVSFIFMSFPLYYKSVNKCQSCGHEFR